MIKYFLRKTKEKNIYNNKQNPTFLQEEKSYFSQMKTIKYIQYHFVSTKTNKTQPTKLFSPSQPPPFSAFTTFFLLFFFFCSLFFSSIFFFFFFFLVVRQRGDRVDQMEKKPREGVGAQIKTRKNRTRKNRTKNNHNIFIHKDTMQIK